MNKNNFNKISPITTALLVTTILIKVTFEVPAVPSGPGAVLEKIVGGKTNS